MRNNQITENIACNSEYYNKILDDNIKNQRFYKVLKNIELALNHSISSDTYRCPPPGGITPVPKLDIETVMKYFHINFFNEPFSLFFTTKKRSCHTYVLCLYITSRRHIIISSKDYIKNGKSVDAITYKGWPVKIQNRIVNSPTRGKDTITIVYTQDIFHFSFHSTTSKNVNGNCEAEDWDFKAKGAFHLKLDCMRRAKPPTSPLVESSQGEQYYFPFVYDISNNNFMAMGTMIRKSNNDVYTSTKTNTMFHEDAVDKNMCHNADSADLWYNYSNGRKFFLRDSSGAVITDTIEVLVNDASGVPITKSRRIPQTYIHKVISPLYNYIVLQLNESMTLPSDQEWHLSRPDTFGRDPAPTPVACSKIPAPQDMILCSANPSYNDAVNGSHVENLNRREAQKAKTSGGKHHKTRRNRQPNL
jgi:hypothetical protein